MTREFLLFRRVALCFNINKIPFGGRSFFTSRAVLSSLLGGETCGNYITVVGFVNEARVLLT